MAPWVYLAIYFVALIGGIAAAYYLGYREGANAARAERAAREGLAALAEDERRRSETKWTNQERPND